MNVVDQFDKCLENQFNLLSSNVKRNIVDCMRPENKETLKLI